MSSAAFSATEPTYKDPQQMCLSSCVEENIKIELEDSELWKTFQHFTNEMIVTKLGRRMFPIIRLSVRGLNPNVMYSLVLEMAQIDQHRWKFINGEWVIGGKAESQPPCKIYVHPEAPNFGSHWMKDIVCFNKIKLTNKMEVAGQISLNSLHKYEPRVHIYYIGSQSKHIFTCPLPTTQFIAVTAYQNEDITALKIRYNPFAKGFKECKERHTEDSSQQTEYVNEDQSFRDFIWNKSPYAETLYPLYFNSLAYHQQTDSFPNTIEFHRSQKYNTSQEILEPVPVVGLVNSNLDTNYNRHDHDQCCTLNR